MAVIAPISFPIGIIPISCATLIIYLISIVFKVKYSLFILLIYIFLGIIGLPVFSSYTGGIGIILGPTGGYIIGYIFMSLIISLLIPKIKNKIYMYPLILLIGTIVLYIIGIIWLKIINDYTLKYAILVGVVPFIISDILKISIATLIGYRINKLYINIS